MAREGRFAGKRVLVTGAAKRLGRATAAAFAREGAAVVIHYNQSAEDAEAFAAELRAQGNDAATIQGDLADIAVAENLIAEATHAHGPIDVLVNNASIFPADRLAEVSWTSFVVNDLVNAFGPFLLARAFAAQGRPGVVINFLDARIRDYDAEHVSYHLSKRLLHTFTQLMAVEFAPRVRVNAVAPGLVLPPEGRDEAYLEALKNTNPLQQYGAADDVAEAVVYLAGAEFVTGQTIYVDGGRHMRGGLYG
ncbi:MAG: SDR family oxidoreductase [Candidatus Hydrogenedentales bacterium]